MEDPVSRTISVYNEIAGNFSLAWFDDPVMEPMIDRFLSEIKVPGDVLDAGCGPGRDVLSFIKRGIGVVGIDFSEAMIGEAKARVANGLFRQMDMRNLKYPSNSFAGIWACASMHHLPLQDAIHTLQEFKRVLKPDGILSLCIEEGQGANFDSLGRFRQYYNETEIRNLLNDSGFKIIEIISSYSQKAALGENRLKKWLIIFARGPGIPSERSPDADDCVFCPDFRFQNNVSVGIPGPGSILWGDEKLYLTPDIAPLTEGHLLLITTPHYRCFGACPQAFIPPVLEAQEKIKKLFQAAYGRPAVFLEHGPAKHGEAGACIEHAHLHCLPMSLPVNETVEHFLGTGQPASLEMLRQLYLAGQSYLYVETGKDKRVYLSETPPSQFMRQIVASLLQDRDWRWQMGCKNIHGKSRYNLTLKKLLPMADALWH